MVGLDDVGSWMSACSLQYCTEAPKNGAGDGSTVRDSGRENETTRLDSSRREAVVPINESHRKVRSADKLRILTMFEVDTTRIYSSHSLDLLVQEKVLAVKQETSYYTSIIYFASRRSITDNGR